MISSRNRLPSAAIPYVTNLAKPMHLQGPGAHTVLRSGANDPEPSSPLALLMPTRLTPPQPRPFWVSRERLIARLASIVRAQLTLVVAPAGFGKSTLVAQWLAETMKDEGRRMKPDMSADVPPSSFIPHPSSFAWLTLDEHDQDGLRFLTYVAGAVAREYPYALTHTLPLLTAQEPPPLYPALQAFLVDLGALPGGLTLILDDYQAVVAEEVHQVVAYLLRHLPSGCHLVILSRIDPPLALARLRAEQQLAELRASDLRFTLDETEALLTNLFGRVPEAALVSSLQQETEGWAIALQLAALAQQEAGMRDLDVGSVRRRVAEYLAEEVFDRQPEPIREALLTLAVPKRFCASLYAALLGAPDDLVCAEERIAELLHANLLLIPLDGEECWYRFHPLFRDLLLRRLRLHMASEMIATLELRAARWLEAEGLFEQAVHRHLATGDETAADVVAHRPALLTLQVGRPPLTLDLDKARPLPGAPAPRLPELLTRREHEILEQLAERWSDKEIAARLVIAPNTVRKHTSTIFGKLGVSNRREAVVVAHALGLLPRA